MIAANQRISSTHSANLTPDMAADEKKNAEISTLFDSLRFPISHLNEQIARFLEDGGSKDSAEYDALVASRDEAISDYVGNDNASAYNPEIAAAAQEQRVSYNRAVDNFNKSQILFNGAGSNAPQAEYVRQQPWEIGAVAERVDQLVAQDGLSLHAAITLAMTERPDSLDLGEDSDSADTYNEQYQNNLMEGAWRENFAQLASSSGAEIAIWAGGQGASRSNTAIVNLGNGNDNVTVSMQGAYVRVSDGTVAGTRLIDPATVDRIVINGQAGDDTITVEPEVTAALLIAGGAGDDTIVGGSGGDILLGDDGVDNIRGGRGSDIIVGGADDDNMEGGSGADIVVGGMGNDYASGGNGRDVLYGGAQRDSLYGGNGADLVFGGTDNDYLDGGQGNDNVSGGAGDDVVSGGKGDDALIGGMGSDRLIGASGNDTFGPLQAGDHIIAEWGESVDIMRPSGTTVDRVAIDPDDGSSLQFDSGSSSEFRSRVQDDLETLRSTDSGRLMLQSLDAAARPIAEGGKGNSVTLVELEAENGYATPSTGDIYRRADGSNGTGGDATESYNPSTNIALPGTGVTPPVVILFHEFAHAFNFVSGNGLNGTYQNGADATDAQQYMDQNGNLVHLRNLERQAVGLTVDHDNDASTPEVVVPWQDERLTENGIRRELGIEERTSYLWP